MMREGKRELLIGAVGLVKGSVKHGGGAMLKLCDELEPMFESTQFLHAAPFRTVSLIIRYGLKWGQAEVGRINSRHSEVEVAIEVPMSEVRMMNESSLVSVFRGATLKSLIAVGEKHKLDTTHWSELLRDAL